MESSQMRKLSLLATAAVLAFAAPTAAQAQDKDIVETAVAAGSFKTLAKLLGDAGLVETLKGPGPFTVFAPTDEAFAKVPAATLQALAADKAKLKSVLLYHVVAGKVMAAGQVTPPVPRALLIEQDAAGRWSGDRHRWLPTGQNATPIWGGVLAFLIQYHCIAECSGAECRWLETKRLVSLAQRSRAALQATASYVARPGRMAVRNGRHFGTSENASHW
jgi:hypothetical protein